jgi:hypothetical protein
MSAVSACFFALSMKIFRCSYLFITLQITRKQEKLHTISLVGQWNFSHSADARLHGGKEMAAVDCGLKAPDSGRCLEHFHPSGNAGMAVCEPC